MPTTPSTQASEIAGGPSRRLAAQDEQGVNYFLYLAQRNQIVESLELEEKRGFMFVARHTRRGEICGQRGSLRRPQDGCNE